MSAKVRTSRVRTFTRVRSRSQARRAPIARRADRLPQLMGLTVHAETVLDQLSVTIVGTGSVGATTALSLAPLGLKEIRLVDYGLVKPTSPATQPFAPDEIGQPKATTIAERCKQLSPTTQVLAFDGRAQDLPMADLIGTNVMVMAGDNAILERDIGQLCLNLGLPLIQGSVHGNSLTAQCRAFATHRPDAPCPLCLYSDQEFKMLDEEHRWSCEGVHSPTSNASPVKNTTPTMSIRSLCALAGEMTALTVLRLALKLGQPVENTLTEKIGRAHV